VSTVAREIIWPRDNDILVRVVFLYVGQGASAIVLGADGYTYKTILIDINLDRKNHGINVPRLMADLLKDEDNHLGVFLNTHPHNDHLSGVVELSDAVDIGEVWHSGHKPGKEHGDAYENLQKVIRKVRKAGGVEKKLEGSRSPNSIGEAEFYVLAPAEYVVDDIEEEPAEERYRRIHEQCAVLKFGMGSKWIMVAGDADRDGWEKHITHYHSDRLQAVVLGAAHHGSRTFFRYDEDSDPYLDALQGIAPTYVVISAPRSDESQWGHPHDDAVKFYADQVGGTDNVLHTGRQRYSFICDIFRDGEYTIQPDNGELVDLYDIGDEGDSDKGKAIGAPAIIGTRVNQRSMGARRDAYIVD